MIVDAHLDIAFNALVLQRNYTDSVALTREREGSRIHDIAAVGLPDALRGGVGLVFGTLFVAPAHASSLSSEVYRTPDEAHQQAAAQLAVYRELAKRSDVALIETRADLAHLHERRERGEQVQGIVVLMEGADPIREPAELGTWIERGVRIIGPAWGQTRYSGGTSAPGPLTALGHELVKAMAQRGVALDVSHMAEQSFWDAMAIYEGPVLASHSNCRALVSNFRPDRHLSDAMLRELISRDAVIGAVLYNKFLVDGWTLDVGRNAVGVEAVAAHIDHVCQLAGNTRHSAIGSDLDGGFGIEAIPHELGSIGDLARIGDALATRGYSEADIAAILGGNWLRLLERVLPAV